MEAERKFSYRLGGWYAPPKDPDAVKDYLIDWTDWLQGDVINTAEWTVPSGITKVTDDKTTTTTTIWLSGGTVAQSYLIKCRITTNAGRTEDQSFNIEIAER